MLATVTDTTTEFITNLSLDIVVIAALFAFFFFIGLRSGKARIIGIIFSTYIAGLLLISFPFRSSITFDFGLLFTKYNIVDLCALILLIGLINIVLDYVLELEFEGFSLRKTLDSIILSASATLAFLAIAYMTNVVRNVDTVGSFLDATFLNEHYLFLILLAPLVGVFIVVR